MPLTRRDRDLPTPERKPPGAIPPGRKARGSTADVAKEALTRRAEPVLGKPDTLKLTVTLYLRRAVAQQLTERAITEQRPLEDIMREILERDAGA
jgi:hypothetical protein